MLISILFDSNEITTSYV